MDFTIFSNNVLFLFQDLGRDSTWCLVVISPYFPLVCDNSFVFSCFSWRGHFCKVLVSYFVECSSVWLCLVFLPDWIEVMDFCRNAIGMVCPSRGIPLWGRWHWYISLLGMLTLISWLWWCSASFLPCDIPEFASAVNKHLGEICWDCHCLFVLKFSPTNFSTH